MREHPPDGSLLYATTVKKILRKEQLGTAGTREAPVAPTTGGTIVSIPHVGDLHHHDERRAA